MDRRVGEQMTKGAWSIHLAVSRCNRGYDCKTRWSEEFKEYKAKRVGGKMTKGSVACIANS